MDITSFIFIIFFAVLLLVYYSTPDRFRWVILLASGVAFYLLGGEGLLILYPLLSALVTWALTLAGKRLQKEDDFNKHTKNTLRRILLTLNLVLLLSILVALKYQRFMGMESAGIFSLAPLGLSFYTFILAGYAIDAYNGLCEVQTNPIKVLLYGLFFPVSISGPILKIGETGKQFFEIHPLNYRNLTFGLQRMLWGFFEKLVLSERLAVLVRTIFAEPDVYTGAYVWFGGICFSFRLYTDFKGCMDIVCGLCETLGIELPDNFDTPFLAKSISEYWRRWHITLGVWMREHVFYPLLRTSLFNRFGIVLRQKLGKKRGKQLTNFAAMLILWTAVGLWHGGALHFLIGSGLLHFVYIVFGEISLPLWKKLFVCLHIDTTTKFANAVRIVRTFILVTIGNIFFNAQTTDRALTMLASAFTVFNPQVLINGSLTELGLDITELAILVVSLTIFIVIDLQHKTIRENIAARPIALRWFLYFALLFYCILLGNYGPGYSAQEFIYQGF